tara:strand:+ start:216 stop:707 length:492 start_codon:yes stop_codon:yes gene_type:complete
MLFNGNWKTHLNNNLKQRVLDTVGSARPRDWPPAFAVESDEYNRAAEAGYDLSAVHWWVYEEKDVGPLVLPLENEHHWWITKLYPGQFMPMHSDPHTHERRCKRYWIPLQDYQPGHIFIYKKELMIDYKAYDVFSYDQSTDLHGAANIGHTPRLVLQVTEYVV